MSDSLDRVERFSREAIATMVTSEWYVRAVEFDRRAAELRSLRAVRDAAETVIFAKENGHTMVEMVAAQSLRAALDAHRKLEATDDQ